MPGVDDAQYWKFLRAFSEVAEPDGIVFGDPDLIISVGVGDGSSAGAALYADGLHGIIAGTVEDVALDRIVLSE